MRSIFGQGERSQVPHHILVLGRNQGVKLKPIHIVNRWNTCSIDAHLLMID